MNPERWQRVDELLEAALELSSEQRGAFLERECGADETLRREVDVLLQAHSKAGKFLRDPALALAARQMASDQSMSLIGRKLAHYEVLSLIGAGGMGEVYRATDPRLGRDVAIKVLPEHLARNADALARFEREAKAVAALSHPNILAIHDVGTDQGIRYAVMELLEGETLRSRVNGAPLPWRKALEIASSVANGLATAHAKNVIHRDLKPENIFLTRSGHTKILDFGLARRKPSVSSLLEGSATTSPALTEPWVVMGTVGYMSPEQVRGEEADGPSDIFSLGCVLYEMVTGKRAFARPTSAETMAAIVRGEHPAPDEFPNNIPPQLSELILRCLKRDPAERYQSAHDLWYDMNALLSRSEVSNRAPVRKRTDWQNWQKLVMASAAITVVAVLGYMWWRWTLPRYPINLSRQRLVFNAPGTFGPASFSPDGGMITFTQAVNGVPQVWVKNLGGGDPIPLTFDGAAKNRPRWSPRNDQIVFNSGTPPEAGPPMARSQSIWTVPPLGGRSRVLIENASNPSWARDGSKLVFEKGSEIWIADPDGTNQHKVEGVPQADWQLNDRLPALSPDAASIAYFHNSGGPLGDFWLIPSVGGQPQKLTSDVAAGTSPTWTPDGRFIVFASQRDGSMTLWQIPAAGGSPKAVLVGAGEDRDPEISSDGSKFIYRHSRLQYTLTLLDPASKRKRALHASSDEIVRPSFSPVDDRICFFAHESGGEIHLSTILQDGTNLTRVTLGKSEKNSFPQWSADGASLYYYQKEPTLSFRKIRSTGGQSLEIVSGWNRDSQSGAQVDPAEERIAYARMNNSAPVATFIRDIKSGLEEKLDLALQNPRWSRDGKRIVGNVRVAAQRDGIIYLCPPGPGPCDKLTTGYQASWFEDSTVYFLRTNKSLDGADLFRINIETRVETRVTDLRPLPASIHMYDVSRQGQIVYVQYNSGGQELWLADIAPPR